jgi:ATP-dependent helicase/nuclease subunit A
MNDSSINTSSLQQKASNPRLSCWVNASAGSGKTKVLIDRIVRLLLQGANPERILCLTFSRAAALEMQQRLQTRVNALAKLSSDEIVEILIELGEAPVEQNISQAINLSEIIQNQPITIQTVHSFCQSLLQRQFGNDILKISPRVMENFEERTYLQQAFQDLLKNPEAGLCIEEFLNFHSDTVLLSYLSSTTRTVQTHSLAEVKQRLSVLFDIDSSPQFPAPNETISAYLKGLCNTASVDEEVDKDHPFAQIFLTQKGTLRSKILTKNLQAQYPEAETLLKIYGEELAHYYSKKTRFEQLQKSLQFWQLQQMFQAHYKQLKQSHNLWDFYDLIEVTLQTLQLDTFDQVLLDLNYRIDHILVDEAQDTSVAQWQVIEHLVQGLFEQGNNQRSLFVVGDEKQSIYSFQGADIRMYEQMRQQLALACKPWNEVHLTTNFRSGQQILKLVDNVFGKNAVGLGENVTAHIPWHGFAGSVEILPLVKAEKFAPLDWPVFEDYSIVEDDEQILSKQVIDYLQNRLANGFYLECENRLATFDDVMILMRKRGSLMGELTALCDQRHIAYTAFDPKNLMKSLHVQDLLSAVEFMLMPLNDLNLAGLLKSPWMQAVGVINEDDLFELCHNRQGHLWIEVQTKCPTHAQLLDKLLQSAPPSAYGYFQIAYDALSIHDELLYAFMEEAFKRFNLLNLGIRELVNHLHEFTPNYTPSAATKNGMRISTVHGAKGLESPIVMIVDNGDEPNLRQDIVLYDPVGKFWFLKPAQAADTVLTAALKNHHQQALEHEHNRLFYVSLTRAQEHLIMAGIDHEPHPSSWYWPVQNGQIKP